MVRHIRRAMERHAVATRRTLLIGAILGMAVTLAVVLWSPARHANLYVIDETGAMNYGLATNHDEVSRVVAADMPPFTVTGPDGQPVVQDNSRSTVLLWQAAQRVRGKHLDHLIQQIGDCVSFGAANAVRYLLVGQIDRQPGVSEFRDPFPPYIYGISRVQIGGGRVGNSDGSIGAWAAKGVQQYGIVASDDPGVPPYSGTVARQWGRQGPPRELIELGKRRLVKTVANVKTADDVRDAICNGYPVTIASDFGSKRMIPQDGRIVAKRDGTRWMHQMCVIAYDGSGQQPYFYVLNNWEPSMHPAPLNGEPPGGFWIEATTMQYIAAQGDSWAFSNFDGFPAQDIDPAFNIFSRTEAQAEQPTRVAVRSFGGSRRGVRCDGCLWR